MAMSELQDRENHLLQKLNEAGLKYVYGLKSNDLFFVPDFRDNSRPYAYLDIEIPGVTEKTMKEGLWNGYFAMNIRDAEDLKKMVTYLTSRYKGTGEYIIHDYSVFRPMYQLKMRFFRNGFVKGDKAERKSHFAWSLMGSAAAQ